MTSHSLADRSKPVAEVWFSIEYCETNILRFREAHIDSYAVGDIWLVRGHDRDLVIDTGSGIVAPAPLINAVAGKPVIAVTLNSSYDHAGGWHSFEERACHPADAPNLDTFVSDQDDIGDYLNDDTLWSLPWKDYRVEDYAMQPAKPTRLIDEGDLFDLGNRSLEVLHTPGRGKGGLTIWEEATGSLFPSDMLYDGDHGLAWPPEYPEWYCASLRRMRDLPVNCVYAGHYGKFGRERMIEIINEQLAELEPKT